MSSEKVSIASVTKLIYRYPSFYGMEKFDHGVPVIRGEHLNDQGSISTVWTDYWFVSSDYSAKYPKTVLEEHDVVMSVRGSVGTFNRVGKSHVGVQISPNLIRLVPDPKKIYPPFFYYALRNDEVIAQIKGSVASSAVPALKASDIKSAQLHLPAPAVQIEAAETLSVIDDRITLLRKTNTTLEAIAQALFKSWFVDFDPVHAKMQGRVPEGMDEATAALFPDSFEESDLGAVPKGWTVGSVGVIAEVIDCLHSKKPELIQSSHPFLQLSNIRDDGLLDTSEVAGISEVDYKKWISRIEASEGDCVITNVGRVGAVAQIPAGYKAAMGRNMTAVRLKKEYPFPTYLVELLQSPDMRTEIAAKTDVGTILDALNVRSIPTLRCVLASHGVLSAFESIARPMRSKMETNIAKIQTLSRVRDTLLPRLISGQLSPNACQATFAT